MSRKTKTVIDLKRIGQITLAVYALLVVLFYFLAGDQLHYRASRGNLPMQPSDAAAAELTQGVVIEQTFSAPIQRLEHISVQWGTYYRANSGRVSMTLLRVSDGAVLMQADYDAAAIAEGQILTLSAENPIETTYGTPLLLRLSADSPAGGAAAPLICTQAAQEGFALTVNGEPVSRMLCFSAEGTDRIWLGLHYWKFAALFGLLLIACYLIVAERCRKGKHSYLIGALSAVKKYDFLIRQLVARDFKTKYKRSVLGIFWSFLNPLLTMLVQYAVFSTIFRSDIPNFAAYLVIGTVMFNFFSEACGMTLTSIVGNAPLITKVYIPKYIYPLTRVLSSMVNLGISLIPMLLVCLLTGVTLHRSIILMFFFLVCLVVFCLGLGLLLSASMVFFRDTQFLWGVLTMMWMYATPIFYPESILPQQLRFVLKINPLYHFLSNARLCVLSGISPEPIEYVKCLAIALLMLLAGSLVFRKAQDRFVLYL